MKYHSLAFFISTLFLAACSSNPIVLGQDKHEHSVAMREVREELADIKHTLNNTRVELQILEEQYKAQEGSGKKTAPSGSDPKVAALEKKIFELTTQASQTSKYLADCHTKIGELEKILEKQTSMLSEISRLKSGLSSLTQSLQKVQEEELLYKVKAGDSLEKIAKLHKVSVNALKEENNLSNNKILVGQELKIPSGDKR